jgi:hypothetical protein
LIAKFLKKLVKGRYSQVYLAVLLTGVTAIILGAIMSLVSAIMLFSSNYSVSIILYSIINLGKTLLVIGIALIFLSNFLPKTKK